MVSLPPALAAAYRIATDHEVRSWSFGLVKAARGLELAGWEEQRGTLADQRIFGPVRDFVCACGKYRGMKYQGMICDRCGVKLTTREARRTRFGHIELPIPVPHPVGQYAEHISAVPVLPAAFIESGSGERLAGVYEDLVRSVAAGSPTPLVTGLERLLEMLAPVVTLAHEWNLHETATLARGLILERRADRADQRCEHCGYPLTGLDVFICPGCGRSLGARE